ncbi:MAG TPA: 2-oxoglutarate dehydrogenase complex dihydrolipoyllysine-residue succinyltransferase [Verrucomicrobiae bacterium]
MAIELKIPSVGESITEVEIGQWLKSEGDSVSKDENVVMLESEKATVELPSPSDGKISKIVKRTGEKAAVGEVIAFLEAGGKQAQPTKTGKKSEEPAPPSTAPAPSPVPQPPAPAARASTPPVAKEVAAAVPSSPAVTTPPPIATAPAPVQSVPAQAVPPKAVLSGRRDEVVRMSPLRRAVARRLVEARQAMAMLTTFNEIDMSAVMALRKESQENFTKKHGVKLGFMSFFVKATVEALKALPQLNASVKDEDIVYHNSFDIGIAIGSEKGLVVPTLLNAGSMSFAQVEKAVADFAARARENKLKPDELQSGTFTITNGGVYGSLLSTPIVNPPQSGILGMHTIQERPIALNGAVVIRPMMYVALSYDHRIVDGKEAVTFLVRVKEMIENPARILLEI